MSNAVLELAEAIKEKGRRSTQDLPPLLERAEEFARDETLDPLSRALAHRAAGNALHLLNNFQPALSNYDSAISILETLARPDELGRTLHAKVGLLMFLSRYEELLRCANRARELFEQLGDRQRLARLDVNLSQAYTRLDRYDLALECVERALPVLEELHDLEACLVASLNSGIALTWMHRFDEAEQRYRRALDLAQQLGMSGLILLCRYNLSYLDYLLGDTAKALRELSTVRALFSNAGDRRHECSCWLDEAEILLEVGDLQGAIASARSARQLAGDLKLNSEFGKSLLFEAVGAMRLGNSTDAVVLLDQATERFQNEHNGVWTAVAKLQTALFQSERGRTAVQDAVAARSLLSSSGLPHRLAFADIVMGRMQRAHGETARSIDSFRSALSTAETSKSDWMQFHAAYELGISLSQSSAHESFRLLERAERMLDSLWDRLGTDDLKLAFLNDRENVYTHLVRRTAEAAPETAFELSEKARSRVLKERLTSGQTGLNYLKAHLASDQAVLEFFVNGNDLTIFVLKPSGLSCMTRTGVMQRIQAHCRNLERHFTSCSVKWERLSSVQNQLIRTAQHHLDALYRELIEPIACELPRRVVIVPHGSLHAVPFHALLDAHETAYTPSASLYCSPATPSGFGPPVFIAFAPDGRTTSVKEVEEAAANFSDAIVLVNPPTVRLQEIFSTPRSLVHLAGHAGIDAVGGTISWIETNEGRLTGRHLTDMSIRARTVVITGCQTARRAISAGDEWQGLMRAFYLAGATTIVSAFWDIRDESARRFATQFYKSFDGTNAETAVKVASHAVRDWRSHPYFWAGFGAFVRNER